MSLSTTTTPTTTTATGPSDNIDSSDLLKILVATDNHLGYNEKDSMTRNDSFITFEEILQNAVQNDVDFILLGGDLFHDSVPSQNAMQKCLKLLRTYTLGDKPIQIEFLSDQTKNFMDSMWKGGVNYEDPNMNVAYPVFSIHGNHDDPCGIGGLSSLDLLSTAGVVNYFGKCVDLTKINISPILIKKGKTQLALYGLSHIHDNRLVRLFNDAKVSLEKPNDESGDWFNLLVVHQNRADRGPKNYLPEDILPEFLDLVIWGHEHDCRIVPEENKSKGFFVTQPGSSVATSLADGESLPKHCGLLLIHEKQFKLEIIPLKTVRPFIFRSINLCEYEEKLDFDGGDVAKKVQQLATEELEIMFEQVKDKLTGHPNQPTIPLLRLRIMYTEEEQMFNAIRMGQQYSERVANPLDIIKLARTKQRSNADVKPIDRDAMDGAVRNELDSAKRDVRVEDVVERYFTEVDTNSKLELFSSKSLAELSRRLVDFNDEDSANSIITFYKDKALTYLTEKMCDEDDTTMELINFRDTKSEEMHREILEMLEKNGIGGGGDQQRMLIDDADDDVCDNDDVDDDDYNENGFNNKVMGKGVPKVTATTRGGGAGTRGGTRGGRGSRGGRTTTKTNVTQPTLFDITISKNNTTKRGGRGSRGGRGAATTSKSSTMQTAIKQEKVDAMLKNHTKRVTRNSIVNPTNSTSNNKNTLFSYNICSSDSD